MYGLSLGFQFDIKCLAAQSSCIKTTKIVHGYLVIEKNPNYLILDGDLKYKMRMLCQRNKTSDIVLIYAHYQMHCYYSA